MASKLINYLIRRLTILLFSRQNLVMVCHMVKKTDLCMLVFTLLKLDGS